MREATVERELGRLRWRCRRGMRELDELLRGYLERDFADAPDAERQAFRALLEAPDPEIQGLCLGRIRPRDEAEAALIARIVARGAVALPQPGAPAESRGAPGDR
ncbi:MAG: succinate dehydrogenase assembly factor 2 [Gammaproteobacteria bacterium]|nr:succinate dehydrogenase assembly factor 2 [Gammaproteobacteria bacterium]